MYTPTYSLQCLDIPASSASIVPVIVFHAAFQIAGRARGNSRDDLVDVKVLDFVIDVHVVWVKKTWIVEGWENRFAEECLRGKAVFVWANKDK